MLSHELGSKSASHRRNFHTWLLQLDEELWAWVSMRCRSLTNGSPLQVIAASVTRTTCVSVEKHYSWCEASAVMFVAGWLQGSAWWAVRMQRPNGWRVGFERLEGWKVWGSYFGFVPLNWAYDGVRIQDVWVSWGRVGVVFAQGSCRVVWGEAGGWLACAGPVESWSSKR